MLSLEASFRSCFLEMLGLLASLESMERRSLLSQALSVALMSWRYDYCWWLLFWDFMDM